MTNTSPKENIPGSDMRPCLACGKECEFTGGKTPYCDCHCEEVARLKSELAYLHRIIEGINPRCRWSDAREVDWTVQTARGLYREWQRKASAIEAQLGY